MPAEISTSVETAPRPHAPPPAREWLIPLLGFLLLWLILIDQLRVEWAVNPQYSYGWVVPLLCIGLLLRRWQSLRGPDMACAAFGRHLVRPEARPRGSVALFIAAAVLILPARLILEANPNWPTPQWLFAVSTVAISLIIIYWAGGPYGMRYFAFPICFILVAVPWPRGFEIPLIQGLTGANVSVSIELLSWLGIPANQHGNLIEISSGVVGVDEACSGIRSFHSSIMIALFLGEYYRFDVARRLLFIPLGLGFAFLFNLCRTTILMLVASHKGIAAINSWHDPAGVTITIACVIGLWGLAWIVLKSKRGSKSPVTTAITTSIYPLPSTFTRGLYIFLLTWLFLVQTGVEGWYRVHEMLRKSGARWTIDWPPDQPNFRELEIPQNTRDILKFDEGHAGKWTTADNTSWQIFYFKWRPGKIALTSAQGHTPDVCLAAAGKDLRSLSDDRFRLDLHSIAFPFHRYEYTEAGRIVHVFHCLWEDDAPGSYFETPNSSHIDPRLRDVLAGRRNLGQRSIEVVIWGMDDSTLAQEALEQNLRRLIRLEAPRQFGKPASLLNDVQIRSW